MSNSFLGSTGTLLIIIGSGLLVWVHQFTCIPILGCYFEGERLTKQEIETTKNAAHVTIGVGIAFLGASLVKKD
jgi:hypothetical protein